MYDWRKSMFPWTGVLGQFGANKLHSATRASATSVTMSEGQGGFINDLAPARQKTFSEDGVPPLNVEEQWHQGRRDMGRK